MRLWGGDGAGACVVRARGAAGCGGVRGAVGCDAGVRWGTWRGGVRGAGGGVMGHVVRGVARGVVGCMWRWGEVRGWVTGRFPLQYLTLGG